MLLTVMGLMASAGAATSADMRPICQNSGLYSVDRPIERAQLRRLDELPPANLVLTVLRTEDGCSKPVIVRYDIGAPAKTEK